MINNEKKICIIGAGGFGRETLLCVIDGIATTNLKIEEVACFMVEDKYLAENKIMGVDVIPQSKFDPELYNVVVAIGDPSTRKKVVESLPKQTTFTTIIHPNAIISDWVKIGEGSIITAGVIITCNIKIGKHSQLNLHTTIGHDCEMGDYFTTAPGANISGNCVFGNKVYFGTNSSVRQGVSICNDVTIGMGGVVVKNIAESGVYIGNPLKKLEKK
ncbi:MAG: transferase [Chloroflexi bacterium]|nr:MAG: transferase [Chloroflexota bacterium]PIE81993.1 MAG: transferase [Chloroflexota bacterium]